MAVRLNPSHSLISAILGAILISWYGLAADLSKDKGQERDMVSQTSLLEAMEDFPVVAGLAPDAVLNLSRSERWKQSFSTLAKRLNLSRDDCERELKSMADRLLARPPSSPLTRACACFIIQDFAQAGKDALVASKKLSSLSERNHALKIAVISMAEEGRMEEGADHLQSLMKNLEGVNKMEWWLADMSTVVHLAARLKSDDLQVSIIRKVHTRCANELGADDAKTLEWQNRLGNELYFQGRLKEAIVELHNLLQRLNRKYGYDSVEATTIAQSLVQVLNAAGHKREAGTLAAALQKIPGSASQAFSSEAKPASPSAATVSPPTGIDDQNARSEKALELYKQMRIREAASLMRLVIEARTRNLGPEHVLTLDSKNNLGAFLNDLHEHLEGENILSEVLAVREKQLPADSLDTAQTRNNYANILSGLGRQDEAQEQFRQTLRVYEKVLGIDHPKSIGARHNLAAHLMDCSRLDEALTLIRQVVLQRQQVSGPGHFLTLLSRRLLVSVLSRLGRHDEAIAEHADILALLKRSYSDRHPDLILTRIAFAWTLLRGGKFDEAAKQADMAELNARKAVDIGDPLVTDAVHVVARVRQLQSSIKHAQMIDAVSCTESLATAAYGPNHPAMKESKTSTADALWKKKQLEQALAEYENYLKPLDAAGSLDKIVAFHARNLIADCLRRLGKLSEAEIEQQKLLLISTRTFGKDDTFCLSVRFNLAQTARNRGRKNEAALLLAEVVTAWDRILGKEHEATLTAHYSLGSVLADLGSMAEGRRHLQIAHDGFKRTLGSQDLHTEAASLMLHGTEASEPPSTALPSKATPTAPKAPAQAKSISAPVQTPPQKVAEPAAQ